MIATYVLPILLAAAAPAADPGLLVQFVKLQDANFETESAAACREDGEQAKTAFHDRYDRRLIEIVLWLQARFSDEDLKTAQAQVHGPGSTRTAPPCPADEAAIAATEARYAALLEAFEARIRLTLGDE